MNSEAIMLWSVLFSGIGLGFFLYGKKQRKVVPLFTGLALLIYPYFITSVAILIIIGVILIALPYFVHL
jgi:predicted membrane protein